MATDILPFVVQEPLSVNVPIGGNVVTAGVQPAKQTGKMGLWLLLGGIPDGTFDLIVETALAATGPAGNWLQLTSSRLNGVTGANTYRLSLVDPVLDQVRVRAVRTGGSDVATIATRWGSDRAGMTAN